MYGLHKPTATVLDVLHRGRKPTVTVLDLLYGGCTPTATAPDLLYGTYTLLPLYRTCRTADNLLARFWVGPTVPRITYWHCSGPTLLCV